MSMKGGSFNLILVFCWLVVVACTICIAYTDFTYDDFNVFKILNFLLPFINGILVNIVASDPAAYFTWIQMKKLEHYKLSKFSYFMLYYIFLWYYLLHSHVWMEQYVHLYQVQNFMHDNVLTFSTTLTIHCVSGQVGWPRRTNEYEGSVAIFPGNIK